jgi:hypothetical protein
VKYAVCFELQVKGETALLGMFERLTEIGRYYGMEIYVKKLRR